MSENQNSDSGDSTYSAPAWSDSSSTPTDATAWSHEGGFDPNTPDVPAEFKGNFEGSGWVGPTTGVTPAPGTEGAASYAALTDPFTHLKELSDMFNSKNPDFAKTLSRMPGMNDSISQLTNSAPTLGTQEEPSNWQRLGIIPGMSKENFFNQETPAQRDTRMGMIDRGLGTVGSALSAAAMPPIASMGMGLYGAYKGWDNNAPVASLGRGLAALPGWGGVAGQAMQGNYGSALTGGLTRSGVNPLLAGAAGLGASFSQGKDITRPASGLAGQFVGQQLGGPVGGVFGQNIGRSLASIYGKK